jgi:hypothetical protein
MIGQCNGIERLAWLGRIIFYRFPGNAEITGIKIGHGCKRSSADAAGQHDEEELTHGYNQVFMVLVFRLTKFLKLRKSSFVKRKYILF